MTKLSSDLTILAYGKTRSSLVDWFIRNQDILILNNVDCILGFYIDDEPSFGKSLELPERHIWICGEENPCLRIIKMLNYVKSSYVLLIGSDDKIFSLPSGNLIKNNNLWFSGLYFFEEGEKLRPSTNNLIEFNGDFVETLKGYWSIPNPSDNSIFYSILPKELCLAEMKYYSEKLYYDAKDWEIVSSRIQKFQSFRDHKLIIIREQTPHNQYTQRVLDLYEQKHINYKNWVFQNPVLFAMKKIYDQVPKELREGCINAMAFAFLIKFSDMRKLSQNYLIAMDGFDIQKTAQNLAGNLSNITFDQIELP
jgi:hypothetical protein